METILIFLYALLGLLSSASFVVWLIFKIKNIKARNQMGRRDAYKNTVKSVRKLKASKILLIIILVLLGLTGLALAFGIVITIVALFAMIIALGGAMYVDTGGDPTGYYNLINLMTGYWRTFLYWGYSFYIILTLVFARSTYINIVCRNRFLHMAPFDVDEIPPTNAIKLTPQQRKKRIIITCSIVGAVIVCLIVRFVFDFDIIGEILLKLP